VRRLSELRDSGTVLSSRSSELLSLESDPSREAFIDETKEVNFVQQTTITCMDILKKDSEDPDALSLLIVGTESCFVFILPVDPTASNILCKVTLPSVPTHLSVSGVFDVEWRISVVCRDGKMYSIKNGEVRGTALLVGSSVDLGSQAVSIVRQDKSLWIATMDRAVSCYSNRGKRLKGMILMDDVVELCVVSLKRAKLNYLLLVALANGEVCMYKELTNIYSFRVDKPIIAMCYGLYGREENSLILVHGSGAITIKIWRRLADVDSINFNAGPPPEQDIPLPVPKKTKLYIEQSQREREKAPEIHRAFQRDLCKLRLTTARAYVKTLTDGMMVRISLTCSVELVLCPCVMIHRYHSVTSHCSVMGTRIARSLMTDENLALFLLTDTDRSSASAVSHISFHIAHPFLEFGFRGVA
jgi:Bardet-Biedl syndrome 1 protein